MCDWLQAHHQWLQESRVSDNFTTLSTIFFFTIISVTSTINLATEVKTEKSSSVCSSLITRCYQDEVRNATELKERLVRRALAQAGPG